MTPSLELNFPNPIETQSDLFDREPQLRLVQQTLLAVPRRPAVVRGERVMGKTSLLNVIAEWAETQSAFRLVQLPHVQSRQEFFSEMLDGLAAEASTSLQRMGLRDDRGRLTVTTIAGFTHVADELSRACGCTFLLCVDELDGLLASCPDEESANQILGTILHIVAKTALPIKFLFTMTRTAPEIMLSDASPFLSAATIAELWPWTAQEQRDYVSHVLRDAYVPRAEAHDLLYRATGGHPYLTKAALSALCGLAPEGSDVTADHMLAAVQAAVRLPEVDFTLDNIVRVHFSAAEVGVLRRLAASPAPLPAAGLDPTAVHDLEQRRYVRRDGSGRLTLAFGLLGDWLLGQPGAVDAPATVDIPSDGGAPADGDAVPTLVIDTVRGRAFLGATEIRLTAQEYRFLQYLVAQAGTVVDRTSVATEVWPDDRAMESGREGRLDALVHRLREGLGAHAGRYIETRRGRGYYANPDHVQILGGPP